jgi:cleavage and polyadenylation specificity factor subunit 1
MEVISAEFLPFEGQLYILLIDADLDIHVLQYDPERMYHAIFRLIHSY